MTTGDAKTDAALTANRRPPLSVTTTGVGPAADVTDPEGAAAVDSLDSGRGAAELAARLPPAATVGVTIKQMATATLTGARTTTFPRSVR